MDKVETALPFVLKKKTENTLIVLGYCIGVEGGAEKERVEQAQAHDQGVANVDAGDQAALMIRDIAAIQLENQTAKVRIRDAGEFVMQL